MGARIPRVLPRHHRWWDFGDSTKHHRAACPRATSRIGGTKERTMTKHVPMPRRKGRAIAFVAVAIAALCASAITPASAVETGGGDDTTGVTKDSITIGNVSDLSGPIA